MNMRDSSGRSVSLLNDDGPDVSSYTPRQHYTYTDSSGSNPSSPATPGFTRSVSCESYNNSAQSPTTSSPRNIPHHHHHTSSTAGLPKQNSLPFNYPEKMSHEEKYTLYRGQKKDTSGALDIRDTYSEPIVYDDDSYSIRQTVSLDRGSKRYPCRYRDSHHCGKTFTTSGHASRHSKIHTAEKSVSCTWEGCTKKFTRSDNMKQHLETHTKERSRASKASSTSSPKSGALTSPAGIKKSSSPTLKNARLTSQHSSSHSLSKTHSRLNSISDLSRISPLPDSAALRRLHIVVSPESSHPAAVSRPRGLDALAFAASSGFHH